MAKRDYYEVLGLQKGADAAAIKTAYRRLAMKHHPDRNPDDPQAEAKFKEVQEAYACLSDSQKRAAYDQFGHGAFEGGMGGEGGPGFSSFFDDIFSDFFGGAGGRGPGGGAQRARRQRVMDMDLTFEEMAVGCEKEVRITLPSDCDACAGTGAEEGATVKTCTACDGHGQVRVARGPFTLQQTCSKCNGEGKVVDKPCRPCNGSGKVNKSRHLQINIPAGVQDGALVRVSMDGSEDELFIRPNVGKHPLFVRDGSNLHIEIPVSIATAALGGEVVTPSVKGGKIKVNIPAGVQNGQVLRVPSCGLPDPRTDRRGNMLCHIAVEVPVRLNSEQKELLRKFDESLKREDHSPKEQSWLDKAKQFFTE